MATDEVDPELDAEARNMAVSLTTAAMIGVDEGDNQPAEALFADMEGGYAASHRLEFLERLCWHQGRALAVLCFVIEANYPGADRHSLWAATAAGLAKLDELGV